nr:S-layer homology domain-containing protein [Acidaminococcus fermentans]
MAETVIPVKLSKGETYEQDLQGHLEQSAEQLGSGIGNRPEPREGTFPAEKYTGGVYALTLALALGLTWPSGAWAADKTVDLGNGGAAAYDNKGNLTVGKVVQGQSTDKKGENNTAIGTQSDTLRNVTEGDTTKNGQPMDAANTKLVDGEGAAHKLDTSTESGGSTAVGYNNKAEGDNSTAIGNTAKITNKPITYYADKDGNKTTSTDNAAWYKDSSGNPTQVPQVFRDADGNTTTVPQYVHTYTVKDPDTGVETTKTEITSDAAKADQKDGKPVYNYQKSDNLDKLYSVTLYQAASNSIAAGSSVTANGNNAVAVGYNSTADNSAVAVGDTAVASENAVSIGKNTNASVEGSIALGKDSKADRSGGITGWDPKTGTTSTQSGLAWKSTEGALSVGSGSVSRQITGVAAGSEDSDAVNLAQLKNAMTHYYSVKTTADTDAAGNNNYLNDGATGDNALAAGVSAVAKGNNATAVGTQTYASGEDASAYGYRAAAMGKDSVSIGSGTSAQQEGAVAIGGHAIGSNSIAIGSDYRSNRVSAAGSSSIAIGGYTNSDYNVAIGSGSSTSGPYAITVGGSATSDHAVSIGGVAGNSQATAVGSGSSATGQQSTAIGAYSAVSGSHAVTVGGTASGDNAVSVGGVASDNATAVGRGSTASGGQSTAVGFQSAAGGSNSTAVGLSAAASGSSATAAGYGTNAQGNYSTALGNMSSARGENSTAVGGASARGKNVTAIGKSSTVEGNGYYDDSVTDATAIGGAHVGGDANYSTAIGSNATTNQNYGVALGYNSNVSYASTGIGSGTKASNTGTAVGYNAQSSGYQSAAVGAGSNATGQNAVSLGGGGAWGNYSIALGSGAGTTAHGIALGQNSGAWGENAIAIGEGTNAWRANSIVLGKNSKSGADKNIEGYDPRTGMASVDDTSTWQSTDEAVSIGRAEERDGDGKITATAITRQLNNLAAGTLDTDAVNVAQLKAATQKVNVHDYSVWSPDTETDTNYTNEGAVAKNSMAAGVSAKATGDSAVAIGNGAQAEGKGATVIGKNAKATGQYATAFGGLETTDKKGNIVNIINTASGASSTAFGQGAQAKGAASLAFGHNTVAGADDGSGQQSVAFGEDTQALGGRSLAFGEKTIAKYNDSVAFGNDTRASSTGATAFGNRTRALAQYSTAWGNATVAADEESTAWGTDTIAGAKLDENGAVTNKYTEDDTNKTEQMDVHGNLAYTYTSAADNKVHTAGIKQMPIDSGSELHDYVVLAGKDGNTYVRDYQGSLWKVNVDANGNVTIDTSAGTNGKVYNGQKKTSSAKTTINGTEVAITPDNVLTKAHEGTNGYNIDGYKDATAFGYSTEASGDYATAFGNDTKAAAAGATAFGYKTLASGENSTAFGENSIAAGKNSLAALGATTTDAATNAAAIGSGAKATLADSVALGSGALANRASGSKGYDVLTGTASTNTSAAWVSNANALAIGNDTEGSLLTRQITGVAAGSLDTDAVNVAQLKGAGLSFTTNTKDASNTTDNYKGYKVVSRKLGDTISIKASDEAANHSYSTANLTTRIAENGDISILMDENPAFTSVTTSDVIFAGNPDLTDKDGKAAKADTNAAYGTKTLTDSQNITSAGNDTQATRLHYKDDQGHTYEVATMDDGQIYAGDIKTDGTLDNTGFARTMNQKTTINGGVTEKDKLTDNNIGVVSNGTDTLTVKLAKDLKDLNSVTTGKTVQNDSGIKITNNAGDETKNVIINGDQISFGGNQVNNMGSGSDGTADGKPTYNTDTNGANIGDVKNIAGSTTDAAKLTGDSNITVTYNDAAAGGKNTVKLNDSITLGSDDGKKVTIDGTKGTITVGDKVSFDGSTGKGSIGGVTIGSQTGVATTKKDGDKAKTEDGTFVTGLTNTTWNPDANGIVSGRAATEDQLKTVSDTVNAGWELDVNDGKQKDVTPTSRKVNFKQGQNIIISGSGDDVTVRTDDTVRFTTINVTGDKDASGSYTGGITIGKQSGGNSANPGPGYYITGLENTSWNSSQIQSGRAATEDQLKQVAEDIKHGTVDGDKYITGGNATYDESGKGSAALTGTNGLEGTISNLHDYYVTRGEVSNDGKTLIMTKNDGTTFNVSLDKVMQSDMRLVKNPASKDGKYTVDNNGDLTITVQDANGTEATKQTITLSGLASKEEVDKGLNFAANSGTAYNAKLGGKVTIKGSDLKTGHDYSEDNLTTEVDADGNITIKMDKDLTANTVTVSGKDGKDGQIGITGKDGADGTVTTIIKTIGKNGTDGKNGTPGVNGTDGITRIVYQDGEAGTTTHTVSTLDDGLKFGANMPVAGKTANPVGNKLNSTINIKGAGTKELDKYSGQNLLTSVEQDADGNTTIHVLMDKNISADSVVVGQEGKAGNDGKDGYIGINGKDGADGITTTIIRTEKGQPGADGKNGKPGVDGTDITRIVYTDKNGQNPQTVATLDDGLKFAGDDGQNDDTKVINKKLNKRLDIVGKAQGDLTDANIGVTKDDNGKLYIRLAKHVNLDDGTLQAGDATIGHFTNTELTTNKGNHPVDGSYTIGLSNKDWSVTAPDYVSGRAATEDQLAKVSEAITNATTAAGKRTVVTVNDKSDPATADPGTNTYGEYDKKNGNLMIAAERDSDGLMTYNIKLNDNLALGKDGADGQEGSIGLTGKDGLPGTDGKQRYSTTIIKTEKGQAGKDGKTGKENLSGTDITRIVYTDKDGQNAQTVATLDDGLKFVGNDGQEVTRKLNETLSIKGGLDKDAVAKASSKNLGVRKSGDGLEIVMTDTPDFTKVMVGGDNKITIGGQTNSDTKNPANGNYITGLNNTKWDKDHVTENRAATEGQLRDIVGSITNQNQGGGFALTSDEKGADKIVKQDLGKAIQIKGDTTYKADGTVEKAGNIKTSIDNGAIKVELNKDVDLTKDGSIKAGETTINKDGVKTNEVKVGDITITKDGINGGAKQITNIASGIDGKQYADAGDNNAASIGDVKQLAKNEAKASEAKSGKNITVKDDHTVNLNDDIILGNDPNKQVAIKGSNGQVVIGSGDSTMTLGKQSNTAGDSNPADGNYLNGLDNRKWDGEHIQNGRAATEDQLKTVSDKVNSGRKFQGDDGKDVTVDLGKTLNIKGGAADVSDAKNIGIVRGDDNTLNVRLAKDLTGLNSVTTGSTTINNSGLIVKTGDANRTITVQDGKVDMGGNQIHNVAPGTAPTDAVNVSQLQQTGRAINQLGNSVNKLGARVDRVGANSAALAALHPLDFDPDDKLDFAVGAGSYSGANAVALGAFYRPNEDVMFSLGGSTGGGENMVNIGATFKLGQHNHVSNSRVAMAKEIRGLKELVAKQEGEMQQLKTLMNQMAGRTVIKVDKDALFPDIPENHWAYDYVTKLARAGIVEGYEDGEFKGNRMMTRYEFAAVIYRAIMAGAGSNPALDQDGTLGKLVKEFDGELKYIRIDVIEKDRHGKPTIERVRTVEDSEKHHGK